MRGGAGGGRGLWLVEAAHQQKSAITQKMSAVMSSTLNGSCLRYERKVEVSDELERDVLREVTCCSSYTRAAHAHTKIE